jgi:hypothetical protein
MSTAATERTSPPGQLDARLFSRVIGEGYGSGAWHGPDLKAALSEVSPTLAFWRPAAGRHNIAEIALHHAFFVRSVIAQLSGQTPEPFIIDGEDWFELSDRGRLTWPEILGVVESQQKALAAAVTKIATDRGQRAAGELGPFDLILGITCHAIYHAGQVQLIKRLAGA